MIYTGEFISKNKINYQVQFITASGNTNKEIILSEQPVTISFESEDDIFKPLKLSGATVRCWVKDYMFDLYSGEAKGVKCIVTNKEDNSVIWCGYVTPNLYSQDYLQHKFELEVECIDALAVLQYIKYNVTDRQVRSFKDIIDDAIQKTGYDLNLNVVDFCNYKLEDMYISDSNFFDEDGEPMTYKEVLENILQYLNLTMLLYADTIYILDYNLIKNDEDAIKLDESIIYSTPTLSLTEVFNKITVNSSLYNIDLDVDFSSDSKVIDTGMVCSREFKGWKATYRTYSVTNEDEVILEGNKLNKLDYYSSEANQYIDFINGYCVSKTDGTYPIKAKKDWQRTISCRVAKSSISSESAPKIKLRKNLGCLVGGSDSLLCLDFSTMVTYYDYPTPSDNWNSGGKLAGREASITLSIKLGNKYVSKTVDSKYVWIDEYKEFEEIFKLNGNDSEQNKWLEINPNSDEFIDAYSDATGKCFMLPKDVLLNGDLEITLKVHKPFHNNLCWYHFKDFNIKLETADQTRDNSNVWGEILTPEELKETDTVYTTTINEDNVSDFGDIDLKVATDTSKGISLSAVAYKDGSEYKFLSSVIKNHNNESGLFEHHLLDSYYKQYSKPNIKLDLTLKGLIAPNTKIVDIYNNNLIINKAEYDLADNTSSLTLIEKK